MKKISYLLVLTFLFSIFGGACSVYAANKYDIWVNFDQSVSASVQAKYAASYSFNVNNTIVYDVEIPETGKYALYINNGAGSWSVQYQIDSSAAILHTADPDELTQSYSEFVDYYVDDVKLEKGTHRITFKCLAGGLTFGGFRLKTVVENEGTDFSKKEGMYRTTVLPTLIEAEDFDLGTYLSSDGVNDGKKYRKTEGIDIYKDTNCSYIKLLPSEYVYYTFDVEFDGAFDMYSDVMSGEKLNIWFDDVKQPYTFSRNTADDGEVLMASLFLKKGTHRIKVQAVEQEAAINYFRFSNAENPYYTSPEELVASQFVAEEKEETVNPIYRELYVSKTGSDSNSGEKDSPFASIGRAADEIKKINDAMEGDIIVNILPGYYKIDEKLELNVEHSGKNGYNVIFRGSDKNSESVIGGGERITGWHKSDNDKIWCAEVGDNIEDFRTMYINGNSAYRARTKYLYQGAGSYHEPNSTYIEDGVIINRANFINNIKNPEDLEIVAPIVWSNHRFPVKDVIYASNTVTIAGKQPQYSKMWKNTNESNHTQVTFTGGHKFYLENAFEFIDEPGEFYYDKHEHIVYYYPFKEEDMTCAEVYAGVTEMLLRVDGTDSEHKVTNIRFENISFKHGAWNEVTREGMIVGQADVIARDESKGKSGAGKYEDLLPAQIEIKHADGIYFEKCTFAELGSSALSFKNDVSNSVIKGNVFKEISGTGISIDEPGHIAWDKEQADGLDLRMSKNITVTNNVLRRIAIEFPSCIGICVYYADGVKVEHNDIKDAGYSGVSLGWGWGAIVTDQRNHSVSYNRIVNTMIQMNDGGAIYTLGPMPNTVINNNYIDTVFKGHGLYYDQGTSYVRASNNVILDVLSGAWIHAWAGTSYKSDSCINSFINTGSYVNNNAAEVSVKEIAMVDKDALPDEAKKVYEESGVEDEYKYLLENTEQPEWRYKFNEYIPQSVFKGDDGCMYVDGLNFIGGREIGYHREVEETEARLNVFYNGEWAKYYIDIEEEGDYNIDLMMESGYWQAAWWPYASVSIDDSILNSHVEIEKVTWQSNCAQYVGKIHLTKGRHLIKLEWNEVQGGHVLMRRIRITPDRPAVNVPEYNEGVMTEQRVKAKFEDISGHWAEKTIIALAQKGIIKGVTNVLFAPEGTLTEKQAALLYVRAKGMSDEEADKYITNGDAPINRESFIKMIMSGYEKFELTYSDGEFTDQESISKDALVAVLGAKKLGITKGDDSGAFKPLSYLTRAEAATFIERIEE